MKVIGKVLRTVLLILLVLAVVLCGILELYPMLNDRAGSGYAEDSASHWMEDIEDGKLLSDISIPGVHDAAANETQLRLMTKCQDKGIEQLLRDGFRYLDIRLGVEEINGKKELSFYHGFLHCLKGVFPWSAHITFEDAAKACGEFLRTNPTETVLFVVKQEHGSESISEFENLLYSLLESSETKDLWLLTDSVPTMGEARGKIVLFRRYKDEAGLGEKAGIYIDWEDQGITPEGADDPGVVMEEKDTFTLYVQDRFSYDCDTKWQVFMDAADAGRTKRPEDVLINFLSTKGTKTYGHPFTQAEDLNGRLLSLEQETVLPGWTVIDFGDAELADIIIRSNIRADRINPEPGGKVYVWEKEGFGSDFTITLRKNGTYEYYAGALSSYIGYGEWTVEEGVLTLIEGSGYENIFHFKVEQDALVFIKEGSSEFMYVRVEDGDRFLFSAFSE